MSPRERPLQMICAQARPQPSICATCFVSSPAQIQQSKGVAEGLRAEALPGKLDRRRSDSSAATPAPRLWPVTTSFHPFASQSAGVKDGSACAR